MSLKTKGKPLSRKVAVIALLLSLASCQVPDYLYYNLPDIKDHRIFPSITVNTAESASSLPCSYSIKDYFRVPGEFTGDSAEVTDKYFFDRTKTVAFVVIRQDSVAYSYYKKGFADTTVIPSFSMSKSFVSALLGIAVHEGRIRSIEQPITDFIPELKDPGFKYVTLRDLLEMRSGTNFREDYFNPFSEAARFYYGHNLFGDALRIRVTETPGKRYEYQSGNTELLAIALERATETCLPLYLQEKIWKPLGMQYNATWSVDNDVHPEVKAFCCLNARALDFARFGMLYEHRGIWNGDTIVPPAWVDESLRIANDSRDGQGYAYTYHWRSLDNGDFFAKGVLGQYIYVSPSKDLVFVRLGRSDAGLDWGKLFRAISPQF